MPDTTTLREPLLIVDSDTVFAGKLAQELGAHFQTAVAYDSEAAAAYIKAVRPPFAIIDVRLENSQGVVENGLVILKKLRAAKPTARIVILSRYLNVAIAFAAAKGGAINCLSKPSDPITIENYLRTKEDLLLRVQMKKLMGENIIPSISDDEALTEHARWALEYYNWNRAEAARRLNMPNRSFARRMDAYTRSVDAKHVRYRDRIAVLETHRQKNNTDARL